MYYSLKTEHKKLLRSVCRFASAGKVKLYIVGGYLRDLVLEREKENPDMDFCLKKNAIRFGRALSREIKAGFVVLDKDHGCCRLVKKIDGRQYTLDFTDFRGDSLQEDLLLRDFTIDTLAAELELFVSKRISNEIFIDLYQAGKDLKHRIIRVVARKSFDDDPLRILRAFSLSSMFGFRIDEATIRLIKTKRNKLVSVSCERIRDELFKIFESSDSSGYLAYMDKLKVLSIIMPEIELMRKVNQGPYHHLDVLEHSFETLRQLELIIKSFGRNKGVQDYLNVFISGIRRRAALIKLGAFLHDIGKPQTMRRQKGKTIFHGHERKGASIARIIARRLKLSNDEVDALNKMVFWHLRPGYLSDMSMLTKRARFRYFRDTAEESLSILLISLADQRSTRGPLTSEDARLRHEKTVVKLIKEYFRRQNEKKFPRLVNGYDLLKKLSLQPGPLIGRILSEIEELQAEGRLNTKQQALEAARRIKSRIRDKGKDKT